MAQDFSYTRSPDVNNKVDLVRLCIGDTDKHELIFTDSEINAVLSVQPIVTYAAASLAEMAAARYAKQTSISIGSTSVSCEQLVQHYSDLAKRLRDGGPGDLPGGDGSGAPTLTMIVGGLSKSEKDSFQSDDDAIQPSFGVGKDDYYGTNYNNFDRDRYE